MADQSGWRLFRAEFLKHLRSPRLLGTTALLAWALLWAGLEVYHLVAPRASKPRD